MNISRTLVKPTKKSQDEEIEEEFEMRLVVHDLATLRGWFCALINRVKVTPTAIMDDLRVEEITSKDDVRLMKKA
jgi:hypothetical protein